MAKLFEIIRKIYCQQKVEKRKEKNINVQIKSRNLSTIKKKLQINRQTDGHNIYKRDAYLSDESSQSQDLQVSIFLHLCLLKLNRQNIQTVCSCLLIRGIFTKYKTSIVNSNRKILVSIFFHFCVL